MRRHQVEPGAVDSIGSYLAKMLSAVRPLVPRQLSIDEADGATLAENVTARGPLPLFDNAAMDGYAVRAADVAAATAAEPVILPVEAEVAAGETRRLELAPHTCAQIMTGAPVPVGADAVVRVEWTDGGSAKAAISQAVPPGSAIRHRGEEAGPGQAVLAAGTLLGAAQIGLLAAAGRDTVLARPRPRVTIVSVGNELAAPGTALGPGRIWESNGVMLAAAARQAGCIARRPLLMRDDKGAVLAALQEPAADTDLLVASGGISMGGPHDSVKAALQGLGTASFCTVAMHPGKPQGFGVVGRSRTPIVMLPGNPVSAFVSFWLFAVPAVRALQGRDQERPRTGRATLTRAVSSPAGRKSFISAIHDRGAGTVAPAEGRAAHWLTSLARANVLIIVPETVTTLAAGEAVNLLDLSA